MKTIAFQTTGIVVGLLLWAVGFSRDLTVVRQLRVVDENSSPLTSAPDAVVIADTIPDAVTRIVERNIFQPRGTAATVSIGEVTSVATTPAPPRPILSLLGIVGGPPWSAIVAGVPGRDGAVVMRLADTLSGLRIATIRRDTVVVRSRDTTWTLSLPRR